MGVTAVRWSVYRTNPVRAHNGAGALKRLASCVCVFGTTSNVDERGIFHGCHFSGAAGMNTFVVCNMRSCTSGLLHAVHVR